MEKQHAAGKMTARERVAFLLDEGSFTEFDEFARHRSTNFGLDKKRPFGDGVVSGYGTVDGRPVAVFSQDVTSFGGSLGEVYGEKIVKVLDFAITNGCPVVGINEGGGARIQEGVVSLGLYGEIFRRNVHASGVVPQISLIMGANAGGHVYSPALTDFVVMVDGTSQMFITGPDVVKTVTGEDVTLEELGGARTHNTKSGVAHYLGSDEEDALDYVKTLLSYLPANNLDPLPVLEVAPVDVSLDGVTDSDRELDTFIPDSANTPYDMHTVIEHVLDDGEFLEVQELFAPNILIGYGRVEGRPVGVVANQPTQFAGTLDIDASEKAARFVRTCDAFGIPVLTFVDVPGFLPGTRRSGTASSAAAPSSSTPTPRPPSRWSPSSPARPTAAPTTSWAPSTSAPTSTSRGRPPRSPSSGPRAPSASSTAANWPRPRTPTSAAPSSSPSTRTPSPTPTSPPTAATSTR